MIITTALLALFSSPAAVQAFQATPSFLAASAKSSSSSSFALYSTETAAEIAANKVLKGAGGVAGELGLPCEDECALVSYPKLPSSVHPGVLSGRALMDLLNDAREKGTFRFFLFHLFGYEYHGLSYSYCGVYFNAQKVISESAVRRRCSQDTFLMVA
jgi:hypothetical protein